MPKNYVSNSTESSRMFKSDFLEGFEDLLRRVLIFCLVNHEADELLECNVVASSACIAELLMHFVFVVYEA